MPEANTSTADQGDLYVLFELMGTTYAVPTTQIREIEMVEEITRVPNAPPFVEGVIYLRGRVIPVVDLRARFGFPKADYTVRSRIIIIQLEEREVGLVVDTARQVVRLRPQDIQPPPDMVFGLSGEFLEGVVNQDERVVLVLNLTRVLTPDEEVALETIAESEGGSDETVSS